MNRIAFAGAAASGKTTAAKHLIDNYGFQLLGFATPLYKLAEIHNAPEEEWHSRIFGWTWDNLRPLGFSNNECWQFMHQVLTVMEDTPVIEGKNRSLLQALGTEVGRGFDENLWTNLFENKVEKTEGKIINDNLRFPNEFDTLDKLGFKTIFLDVPDYLRAERYEKEYGVPMTPEQLAHSSEAYLPEIKEKCDEVYDNSGDITNLIRFIDDQFELNRSGS